ncbi:hypothetical protein PPO43_14000 [Saprospira sp. CCB-QB6]|uniref:hypothetical protein n=1 Tax=Saprospira sp. CCB-QB6 TaxID=3023936 RepID=UPI00234AD62C|nr:hypothetical protein [Saprospira sp. CCB-QB6]WCL81083.1 hypothetical protein PPO43_14000 [Saprospira sp. CCB-QB6]
MDWKINTLNGSKGFNAALPAKGLVFNMNLNQDGSQFQFQCCFACKGFSIQYELEPRRFTIPVSMLLSLQWV